MTGCPAEPLWRSLLIDDVPPAEAAALGAHLETCAECQRTLELCAADRAAWADVPRTLAGRTDEPALRELIDRLKNAPDEPDGDPLDFSEPSTAAGSLGRLGPYEVLGEIGRGGMGIVLKALDPKLHRAVALKVLAPQLAVSAAARKRFTREARAAAAVGHPNVVAIHAVDEFRGLPYLVMQLIEGPSLHELVARDGPLPVETLLTVGTQLAAGLAAAHARGLVHRDVKPANVLLEDTGESAKLVDFGLARAADDVGLTRTGAVAGTPQYMAPEQADGRGVDARADLYALGAVLYFAAAGRPPFAGGHPLNVLRRAREERPTPLRSLNPQVPVWLEAVVMRLLEKEPADRFDSAAEVAALLERGHAHWRDPRRVPLPAALRPPRRAWPLAALALAACAVLAGVVIKFQTADGTLVVEVDDPMVEVRMDGSEVVIHGAGVKELRVKPGQHTLTTVREGKPAGEEVVTVTSGGKQVVRVRREVPAVASKKGETSPAGRGGMPGGGRGMPPGGAIPGGVPGGPGLPDGMAPGGMPGGPGMPGGGMMPGGLPAGGGPGGAVPGAMPGGETGLPGGGMGPGGPPRGGRGGRGGGGGMPGGGRFGGGPGEMMGEGGDVTLPEGVKAKAPARQWNGLHEGGVTAAALTPDGTTLVTAGRDGKVRVWDFATGKFRTQFGFDPGPVTLAMAPDGKWFVAASAAAGSPQNDRLVAQELATGKILWTYKADVPLTCVAVSPDGKTVAAGGDDGTYGSRVIRLDPATGKFLREEALPTKPAAIAFAPSGKQMKVAAVDGYLLTFRGGEPEYSTIAPTVHAVAFASEDLWAASRFVGHVVLHGRGVAQRDATEGRVDAWLHAKVVTALTFAPDAGLLLTGGEDGLAKLWKVDSLKRLSPTDAPPVPMLTLPCGDAPVRAALFTPDGKSAVTAGDDGTVRVWDVAGSARQ